MEAFQDFEAKITCPYDKSHFIRKSKMGAHLVKCAKNFPDAEVVVCDFNVTHRIPRPELRYHHETCPDRRKIENHIIQQENEDPSLIYPVQQVNVDGEDDWDNEPEHPGYNPTAYCEENNVLRHIDVESASKRRNFRAEERQRLNQFRTAETAKSSCSTNNVKNNQLPTENFQ
ncbi:hypothetical protein HHI36_017644 [Cryptolaemus montrouzieri]|uniref:CHHC U11-48K-type domain-containing protein n=1 Tax=Cryptolaemus montrouzieri TaxID=559131 RepID=A0ABD2NNM5_9CUCU